LKSPPLIRKNSHAFTAKEKPKLRAMNNICDESLGVLTSFVGFGAFAKRATWVPENPKNRNRVVPTNSALVATK